VLDDAGVRVCCCAEADADWTTAHQEEHSHARVWLRQSAPHHASPGMCGRTVPWPDDSLVLECSIRTVSRCFCRRHDRGRPPRLSDLLRQNDPEGSYVAGEGVVVHVGRGRATNFVSANYKLQ
jgi:hypothetical protein